MEPRSGTHRKIKPRCIVNYSTSRRPAIDAYVATNTSLLAYSSLFDQKEQ